MATVQMKAEVYAKQSNTQTKKTLKYRTILTQTYRKTSCTNSQARDAHSSTAHMLSPFVSRSCFVLAHHINLNKERNKRARCLRVDALTINAPRLVSTKRTGEVQRPLSPMFRGCLNHNKKTSLL